MMEMITINNEDDQRNDKCGMMMVAITLTVSDNNDGDDEDEEGAYDSDGDVEDIGQGYKTALTFNMSEIIIGILNNVNYIYFRFVCFIFLYDLIEGDKR